MAPLAFVPVQHLTEDPCLAEGGRGGGGGKGPRHRR